jgi:hypothetical protein
MSNASEPNDSWLLNYPHSIVNPVATPFGDRVPASSCIDDTVINTEKLRRQLSALDRLHRRINLRFR